MVMVVMGVVVDSIPCGVCSLSVSDNNYAFFCDVCTFWQHSSCVGLTTAEYSSLQVEGPDSSWSCLACCISNFPSSDCSKLSDVYQAFNLLAYPSHSSNSNRTHLQSPVNVSIFYTNCRSILQKLEELSVLASSQKPNFIALTETWLDGSIPNKEFHNEFEVFGNRC